MTARDPPSGHSLPPWPRFAARELHASSEAESIDATDDWNKLEKRISYVPEDAVIRGMFPRELTRYVSPLAQRARYLPFSTYPMREYLELILLAARARYPTASAANAVLKLGLGVYSVFASSLAGIALFSIAQVNFQRLVELSPKAYDITLKPGEVRVVRSSSHDAEVEFRQVWAFPEIFHVGIWLGGMQSCGLVGTAKIMRRSPCDADVLFEWRDAK